MRQDRYFRVHAVHARSGATITCCLAQVVEQQREGDFVSNSDVTVESILVLD